MGLKGGASGVKAVLKDAVPSAFRKYDCLTDLRRDVYTTRDKCAIALDGNVLMMAVPTTITTFDQYCRVVYGYVRDAVSAGGLVVIVFDEPDFVSKAKQCEQQKRDSAYAKKKVCFSDDQTTNYPSTDAYDLGLLRSLPNVHVLKENRATRMRFYDEVVRYVYERIQAQMESWSSSGHNAGNLLVDGADPRGGLRPNGEKRIAQVYGTCNELALELGSRPQGIGEGDLKLQDVTDKIRKAHNTPSSQLSRFTLVVQVTIDTDCIPISLTSKAKQRAAGDSEFESGGGVHCVLAMRERRSGNDRSSYTSVDVSLLESNLQRLLWGQPRKTPSDLQMAGAICLLVAGMICSGCDFVNLKGARFDHFFSSLPGLVRLNPEMGEFLYREAESRDVPSQLAIQTVRSLCACAATFMHQLPRYKKQAGLVKNTDDLTIKRVLWTLTYWKAAEPAATENWGFLYEPEALARDECIASS
jgi:hypothetical protein